MFAKLRIKPKITLGSILDDLQKEEEKLLYEINKSRNYRNALSKKDENQLSMKKKDNLIEEHTRLVERKNVIHGIRKIILDTLHPLPEERQKEILKKNLADGEIKNILKELYKQFAEKFPDELGIKPLEKHIVQPGSRVPIFLQKFFNLLKKTFGVKTSSENLMEQISEKYKKKINDIRNTINLNYATKESPFFSKLNIIKQAVVEKSEVAPFNNEDEFEIGRGNAYAVLSELEGQKITIQSFRDALNNNGITDQAFQNKILNMLIQHRVGIQYRLGSHLLDFINHANTVATCFFTTDPDYKVKIKINNNSVDLIYKAIVNERDLLTSSTSKAFNATITINISSEKSLIKEYNITKINNSIQTQDVFNQLKSKQQDIADVEHSCRDICIDEIDPTLEPDFFSKRAG